MTKLSDDVSNDVKKEIFVSCIICLANCFEYTEEPESALTQLLGVNEDALNDLLLSKQDNLVGLIVNAYNSNSITKENIKAVCDILTQGKQEKLAAFQLRAELGEKNNKFLLEYIHILAHSLSEYSAKKIYTENVNIFPKVSLLQITSRFLIDWVAKENDAFITCQATVRAENDACREALYLLMHFYNAKFSDTDNNETDIKKAREKAELEFYIMYFAEQELRYNYLDKNLEDIFTLFGDRFKTYAENNANVFGDKDSLFYYHVIRFKFLLKKKAEEALMCGKQNDYTEVDEAYIQLLDAKHQELKHVFDWLIDESTRLEKLYGLFRQFRYLNTGDIPSFNHFNMQEFLRLSIDKKGNTSTDCAEILTKAYHEIEKRNRILILAPVQEAPSCAFSVRNIDSLFPIDITGTVPKYDGNISSDFHKISTVHMHKVIYESRVVKSKNHFDSVRWAFVYRQNLHFFMYYKGFQDSGRGQSEMFPAVLVTDTEKSQLIAKLANIICVLDQHRIPWFMCNKKDHSYVCHTRIIKYGENTAVDKALLDLLVFIEYDFYPIADYKRLQNDDCVLISKEIKNGQDEYQIIIFSNDISESKDIDVCHLVNLLSQSQQETSRSTDYEVEISEQSKNTNAINFNQIDLRCTETISDVTVVVAQPDLSIATKETVTKVLSAFATTREYIKYIDTVLQKAIEVDANIIVFPELCIPQKLYPMFGEWTKNNGANKIVVAGSTYYCEDKTYFNTAAIFFNGLRYTTEKLKASPYERANDLAADSLFCRLGHQNYFVNTPIGKFGVVICADIIPPINVVDKLLTIDLMNYLKGLELEVLIIIAFQDKPSEHWNIINTFLEGNSGKPLCIYCNAIYGDIAKGKSALFADDYKNNKDAAKNAKVISTDTLSKKQLELSSEAGVFVATYNICNSVRPSNRDPDRSLFKLREIYHYKLGNLVQVKPEKD